MDEGYQFEVYSRMGTWNECIDRLYDTKDFADIIILVRIGSKTISFKAHKWILSLASCELYRIISELNTTQNNSILIENAEFEDVEIMLSHIYKRKIMFSSEEQSLNVLALARRYHLTLLEEMCVLHIEHRLQARNACEIYQRALALGQSELLYKSFQFIQKETSKALKEADLMSIQFSTLEDIFRQECLNIDSEFELLETLVEWGKTQLKVRCNGEGLGDLREIVFPLLQYIRFLHITKGQFAEIQAKTGIFSDEEAGKILMKYFHPQSSRLPEWFNQLTDPRMYNNDVKIRNIPLYSWHNISDKPYCCSEFTKEIISRFMVRENDLLIRRFLISICKECAHRNKEAGRNVIQAKVSVMKGNLIRGSSCQLHVSSVRLSIDYQIDKDFYKCVPLVLKEKFDEWKKMNFNRNLGMCAPPTLNGYLQYDISNLRGVKDTPHLLPSIKIEVLPPLYIRTGEVFSLSMESELPFYSCRSRPLFDSAPFSVYNEATKDPERLFVWCSFDSIEYGFTESEESFSNRKPVTLDASND